METIVFGSKKFRDIPKQDNPAYGNQDCYMICGSESDSTKFAFLMITPCDKPEENETVTRLAEFFTIERAEEYGQMLKAKADFVF
jgi:hypothetical protein